MKGFGITVLLVLYVWIGMGFGKQAGNWPLAAAWPVVGAVLLGSWMADQAKAFKPSARERDPT